jgi:thioredoxin
MSTVNYLNDQNFESEVLQSDVPVLVDFYADWCGPCNAIAPMLEEIANEASDNFHVAKLDIDANTSLAETHEVHSIPTLILFKNGEPVERFVGVIPKDLILERTRKHLSLSETS